MRRHLVATSNDSGRSRLAGVEGRCERARRPRSTSYAGRTLRSTDPPNGRDGRRAVPGAGNVRPLPATRGRARAPATGARTPAIRLARPLRSVHSPRDLLRSSIDPTLAFCLPPGLCARRSRAGGSSRRVANRFGRRSCRQGLLRHRPRPRGARRRRHGADGASRLSHRPGDPWLRRLDLARHAGDVAARSLDRRVARGRATSSGAAARIRVDRR
jgi:hypothetical protein